MFKVMIVSMHPVFQEGLRVMLEETQEAMVVGTFGELPGVDAEELAASDAILLADCDKSCDLSKLRVLCRRGKCRVCILVRDLSSEFLFQLREAGIAGIISTRRPAAELMEALRAVAEGQLFFDPLLHDQDEHSEAIHLSPREGQLVELLTRGFKNKEIATQLGITEGTVKVYLSKLFQKVGAKDRFELALSGLKNLGLAPDGTATVNGNVPSSGSQALRTFVTRLPPERDRRPDGRVIAS